MVGEEGDKGDDRRSGRSYLLRDRERGRRGRQVDLTAGCVNTQAFEVQDNVHERETIPRFTALDAQLSNMMKTFVDTRVSVDVFVVCDVTLGGCVVLLCGLM